jgi:hypothetical protein
MPAEIVIEQLPYGMIPSDHVDVFVKRPDFIATNGPGVDCSTPMPGGSKYVFDSV